MRSFLIILYLVFYFFISLPLYLVALLIRAIKGEKGAHSFAQPFVQWGWRCLLWLAGTKLTVLGKDKIPDEPVLYVSNHRSYFDIVAIYSLVPGLTGFVAKKEMSYVPLISTWMRFMHGVFLDRKDLKEGLKAILEAADNVKNGYSMYIAPEGTRNHEREMIPFHDGSLKIAQRSGCRIVPVACLNTDDIYELHRPWVRSVKAAIIFGDPIDMNELETADRRHISPYVQEKIRQMIEENRHLVEE